MRDRFHRLGLSREMFGVLLVMQAGACRDHSPHSIAEAVAQRNDEFPANSFVLVPMADLSSLGEPVDILEGRRARPKGTPCFDVAPRTGASLKKIELSYKAGVEFQAEVKELAAKVGGDIQSDDTATVALEDLKVVEGFGVPVHGSACKFHKGSQTVDVITSTVVAGSARIQFSRNISFRASAQAGWTNGGMTAKISGSDTESGLLQGSNIVVVGVVTRVAVDLSTSRVDLGATPQPGRVISFPEGYGGNVRIDSLDAAFPASSGPLLHLTANTRMSANASNVPAGLKACTPGESVSLKAGEDCFVWNETGASGVDVWFEPMDVEGSSHIKLHIDGYATSFAPSPGPAK